MIPGIASLISAVLYLGLVWASTWYDESNGAKTLRALQFAKVLVLIFNIFVGIWLMVEWEFPFVDKTAQDWLGVDRPRRSLPVLLLLQLWPYILSITSMLLLWDRLRNKRRRLSE